MLATCIYPKYWNFYEFQNLTVQLTDRKNPMKNFNSFDSRWIVETTVKIVEISGGEEISLVWLKMADRGFQVFHHWILVTP